MFPMALLGAIVIETLIGWAGYLALGVADFITVFIIANQSLIGTGVFIGIMGYFAPFGRRNVCIAAAVLMILFSGSHMVMKWNMPDAFASWDLWVADIVNVLTAIGAICVLLQTDDPFELTPPDSPF